MHQQTSFRDVSSGHTGIYSTFQFYCLFCLGELILDCTAHDLSWDIYSYGETFVDWIPLPAAKQTLRPSGDGLLLHRLMYPSVTINFPMMVESVVLIGRIFSAAVTVGNNTYDGLNDLGEPFLVVDFSSNDPNTTPISTSSLIVTSLTPDLTTVLDDEFTLQIEVIGCPILGKY